MLTRPKGVCTDSANNVYVSEYGKNSIRKITPARVVKRFAPDSTYPEGGVTKSANFSYPEGLAMSNSGYLYVIDSDQNTVFKVTPRGFATALAGSPSHAATDAGSGTTARFSYPDALIENTRSNLFVCDVSNNTIREVTPNGSVSLFAGNSTSPGTNDGPRALAKFNSPSGIAQAANGNTFIADRSNNTIRKIDAAGQVTTFAGIPGRGGVLDGKGTLAMFNQPAGLALDVSGNLYVADRGNHTIRRIGTNGQVLTIAGQAGKPGSADGASIKASFNFPTGIALDSLTNVYVSDSGNNTIRRIDAAGQVTTIAGLAGAVGSQDGLRNTARFYSPAGLCIDAQGSLFVVDKLNFTIRRITQDGQVSTIGGSPRICGGADGVGSAARFAWPSAIAVDKTGRVYIADSGNNRISTGVPAPSKAIVGGISVKLPMIRILTLTSNILVEFDGKLQSADSFLGPYTNVEHSASPLIVPRDAKSAQFYRVTE